MAMCRACVVISSDTVNDYTHIVNPVQQCLANTVSACVHANKAHLNERGGDARIEKLRAKKEKRDEDGSREEKA